MANEVTTENKTGLLVTFIGLIISLFTGFGTIVAIIGLSLTNKQDFKTSRNYFIGTLIASVVGFFASIALMGGILATARLATLGVGGMVAGMIGFMIMLIAVFIAIFICNLRAYSYMLRGCTEITDGDLAEKIDDTRKGFEKSLKGATVAGIIATVFMWVPVLNIILFLIYLGFAIWYFVMRIMVIIRIWQTYQKI